MSGDTAVKERTIKTRIPGRLDRLPWSRFHWRVLIGLGTVWILDGLEVTMVGTVSARITEKGSGLDLSASGIGIAGAIYIVGACIGALIFGHLTDRFGRKKLFILTLTLYILATFATAFAWTPIFFFIARFFTGAGIGGEYAAVNSAIDELIPARVRGRIDLIINGTYWAGSAVGSALALIFLNKAWFAAWLGWRLAFGIGIVLGLSIMLVRRHVPESPRWLFIHGREEEAERIVNGIEGDIRERIGVELDEVHDELTVRQRATIPFRTIGHTAFKLYPKRAVLGLALFVGQAFIYNGVTFNLGTLFSKFYHVSSGMVPIFVIVYALGNLLGPLTLGRLFDTVGRKPMISGTYIGSAIVTIPLGIVFVSATGSETLFIVLLVVTFFLASAGASAAYLTVSEIFPMETRALAIAFFYALGTAVGGIAGPLLFGQLIGTGDRGMVVIAFYIGAVVMAIGGVVELLFGVKAEGASLESIATPLTAAGAESGGAASGAGTRSSDAAGLRALQRHAESERARARAAEHRGTFEQSPGRHDTDDGREVAGALAEIDDLRAAELEQLAEGFEELADSGGPGSMERAEAARQRAWALTEQAEATSAPDQEQADRHTAAADAATERSRSREKLAQAADLEGGRDAGTESEDRPAPRVVHARGNALRAWSLHHEARAAMFDARVHGDEAAAGVHEQRAAELEQAALAAEQHVAAAEHRSAAQDWEDDINELEAAQVDDQERLDAASGRRREESEREERIRQRVARRRAQGLGRLRPGPGRGLGGAWSGGPPDDRPGELALDREINSIVAALDRHGQCDRQDLARHVAARLWGPGRFGAALSDAVAERRIRRVSARVYGPLETGQEPDSGDSQRSGAQ